MIDGRRMNVTMNGKLLEEVVFQIFAIACCCGWRDRSRGEVENE